MYQFGEVNWTWRGVVIISEKVEENEKFDEKVWRDQVKK